MEGFSGEVSQQHLKTAKGQCALVEVGFGVRSIQAQAFHILMHPPKIAVFINVIEFAFLRCQETQGMPGIGILAPQEMGDGAGVFHKPHRFPEDILIDLLQNIAGAGIGVDF